MSDDGVFPGGDLEGIHVIGYLSAKFDPQIPDALLCERSGGVKILLRDGTDRECSDEELRSAIRTDLFMDRGQWLVVADERPRILSAEDVGRWRDRTATDLVQRAMETRGEPLRVLRMLESAARLRSLNLADFVSSLTTRRADADEGLDRVFLRVRGSREGGQTG